MSGSISASFGSGTTEVLATSLHYTQAYPAELFKALYHLRWGIETDFRRLKQTHVLENFSGRTPLAVRQDFHAQTLLKNLACLLARMAQPRVDHLSTRSKHRWQANYTRAVSRLKHTLVALIVTPT